MPPPDTAPPAEDPAGPQLNVKVPKHFGDILLTIRTIESGGNYTIPKNKGGASGAYQYIDSTWNNFKGYPSAYLAPAAIQDERALADVKAILWTWKGDVSMVPVIWYYPKAARDPALMDQVPKPWAGQPAHGPRVPDALARRARVHHRPAARLPARPPAARAAVPDRPPSRDSRQRGDARRRSPSRCSVGHSSLRRRRAPTCAKTAPTRSSYGQKVQPILAAVNGVVTAVEEGDPLLGSVSVTISDTAGRTFRYSGFNDDTPGTNDGAAVRAHRLTILATVGTQVRAGQVIGFMGDTDPMPSNEEFGIDDEQAVWPHLRLSIHDADGTKLDADMHVAFAQRRQACHVSIGPWSVPPDPSLDELDLDDVVVSALFNGGWVIHSNGTVTATGKSTLIVPPEGCTWAPTEAFGPGAKGSNPELKWGIPIEVPAALLGERLGVEPTGSDTDRRPRLTWRSRQRISPRRGGRPRRG